MTHRHAYRRHVTPRPSDRDLRLINRLLRQAEKLARTPCANPLPFVRAAEGAAKAILPIGHQGESSVFVRLIRLGKGFMRMPLDARREAISVLGFYVEPCREALEAPPQPRRRDVHG